MRTLFLDLETAPTLGYFYGRRDINISPDQVVSNGFILCYQAAWNDGPVFVESLRHKKKLGPKDDRELVKSLSRLVSSADVVVAHNGDKFDLARLKARLAVHNLPPFIPPQTFDTLKVCRRFFMFEANSLDSVCRELGLGRKFHSGGYETSLACMRGDQKSWAKLLRYGKQDVILLRKLYYRIRPFASNHPNQNLYDMRAKSVCPTCGSEKIEYNGYRRTLTMLYHRFRCKDCGAHGQERKNALEKDKRVTVVKGT